MTTFATANVSAAPRVEFSRVRFAALVGLGVYPLITALLYIIFPLTEGWETWQRTLVIVPLMVVAMTWGLIPGVHSLFGRFINTAVR
jgi:antibiotic biosynthesis monooxygenase (ABM) superfamily enzyme